MEQDKIWARWHEYISELYDDNRGEIPQVYTESELTPVTRREVEFTLKGMPLNKAPGPDNIFTEMLVVSGEADCIAKPRNIYLCICVLLIWNYINGRKAYTTYRNHTYIQHQF